jgi:uncharacterized membrane protein YkoI
MLRRKIVPIAVFAALAAGGVNAAAADEGANESNEPSEIASVLSAKVTLGQAISTAETETGAKAVESGLENHDGAMVYTIKVAKGDTVQTVLVDPNTGKVTKVTAGNREDEENAEHGED